MLFVASEGRLKITKRLCSSSSALVLPLNVAKPHDSCTWKADDSLLMRGKRKLKLELLTFKIGERNAL